MSKPETKVMTITPEMAAEWLKETEESIAKGDFRQRSVSEIKVHSYAQDIRNGQWLFNHQGIAFDDNGMCIDGRHRLHAVIKAKTPIIAIVTTGLPSETVNGSPLKVIDTIDRGRPRSIAQQLQMSHGIAHGALQAGIARALAILMSSNEESRSLTTYQTLFILEKMFGKSVWPIIEIAGGSKRARFSSLLAPIVLLHNTKPEQAIAFIKKYVSLEGLKATHPVLVLYKHIANQPGRASTRRVTFMKAVSTALMYFCRQQDLTSIRGSEEGREWLLNLDRAKLSQMHKLIEGTTI